MSQKRIIHLVLKANRDKDLICWKNSLEAQTFNKTVNQILFSEARGKTAEIPYKFKVTNDIMDLNGKLILSDEKVIKYIDSIEKKDISSTIREIIRKHIKKNKQLPVKVVGVRYDVIVNLVNEFDIYMRQLNDDFKKYGDVCLKLNKAQYIANKAFYGAILNCFANSNEEICNKQLKKLDYKQIADKAFNDVFSYVKDYGSKND